MNLTSDKKSRGWLKAFEYASPLLNALALTAFFSLMIGLVFGGALFGTSLPNGWVLSFQSWFQHLLSPFSTWKFAQGQMALLHPLIDVLSGEWFGLRPFAHGLFVLMWVLSVGLLFRSFQKGWNALGYTENLGWGRFSVGLIGLLLLPLVALILLSWLAHPFEPFILEAPWLKVLFMGLVAWVSYAGIIIWTSPRSLRVYAALIGASWGAFIFALLELAAQWVMVAYGPFSFLTHSMGFVVWNFCLWFSLCVGFAVVLRYVNAPQSLSNENLGDRLTLCLSVLKAVSKRAIRGGQTNQTTKSLAGLVAVPKDQLSMALSFLEQKSYLQSSSSLFKTDVEWQLTAPLHKLSMQKLLRDVDGSVVGSHQIDLETDKPETHKVGQTGVKALAKLEAYWSGSSIATFLDWQWLNDATEFVEVPAQENDPVDEEPVPNVLTWFAPEFYLQASSTDTADVGEAITTLDDVQQAIANVDTSTPKGDDQPSIGDIIRKLSVSKD